MGNCKCGCGEPASNGNFISGHGQKLTACLVKEAGGLFALQELVDAAKKYSGGTMESEEFTSIVRKNFTS